ncbi:VOC family protein [Chitinimonas sp. PSY-7]|uniref:VOC family protein n=1 Tax=Chitinimonas sp. PSY-7 TaxID=3459088 RepID=UPI00403FCDE4
MKENIKYEFHHTGIPTSEVRDGELFSANVGMYTTDNPGKFRIQWHRFTSDSPLHPLIKTLPHVAFKVSDLYAAIEGEEVILGPYEPIDDYFVAMINDGGVPVELIQTSLSDEEIWGRAKRGEGSLYRTGEEAHESLARELKGKGQI